MVAASSMPTATLSPKRALESSAEPSRFASDSMSAMAGVDEQGEGYETAEQWGRRGGKKKVLRDSRRVAQQACRVAKYREVHMQSCWRIKAGAHAHAEP
jgi:hypothetical protein